MDPDPGVVYLLETAKDRLQKALPGYRIPEVDSFLDGVLAALRGGEPPSPGQVRAVVFPVTTSRRASASWSTGSLARGSALRGERGTLSQLAGAARFTTLKLRPGYRMADVDGLLAEVEQALAGLAW